MGCASSVKVQTEDVTVPRSAGSGTANAGAERAQGAAAEEEDWSWKKVILGRYAVNGVDVLGIGNFSVVRKASDMQTGATVAVKSLKEGDCAKFRREVFLFEHLFSAGAGGSYTWQGEDGATEDLPPPCEMFVRLLDHSTLDDQPFYCVLELGAFSLQDLITHCRDAERDNVAHSLSTEAEFVRVTVQTARALAFLHSRLFVHGDLKPANLMWFGAWKLIDIDGLLTTSQLLDMREADFYTPIFSAPELAQAVAAEAHWRATPSLDMWALGAMVLTMDALQSPLWAKFEELGEAPAFMRWLAQAATPLPLPQPPRAAPSALLQGPVAGMLSTGPRPSPLSVLRHPSLTGSAAAPPPPTLQRPEPQAQRSKPLTAFQLFQERHKPTLEQEGLKGVALVRELQRRWKELQEEGGPELEELQRREAELRADVVSA